MANNRPSRSPNRYRSASPSRHNPTFEDLNAQFPDTDEQEEIVSEKNKKSMLTSNDETSQLLNGELEEYLSDEYEDDDRFDASEDFNDDDESFDDDELANCDTCNHCDDCDSDCDNCNRCAYDDDEEFEEEDTLSQFFPLISVSIISLFLITLIATLCFPVVFLKILLLLEILAFCGYFIYLNLPEKEDTEGEEKTISVIIDKIKNGFEFIYPNSIKLSLSNLILKDSAMELNDLMQYINNPEEFEEQGYQPETKVLFIGETGCGKDTLIKAFSKDTELPILRVHASRFFESKAIFESLFSLAPYTSYILEIDSIESLVSGAMTAEASSPEIVLDKLGAYLEAYPNVILFATCENPVSIVSSNALSKFFKKIIVIDSLDYKQRIELLKTFSSKYPISGTINYENLAKSCIGFNIGEIKYLVNAAMETAHKDNRKELTQNDFFNAFDSLQFGTSNSKHTDEFQKIVAYHEAGHAIVSYLLSGNKAVLRVISTAHGGAGGLTLNFLDENKVILTEKELLDEVCVFYAGRCAEKIIFNNLSTGASSDIERATSLISSMIEKYGMSSEIGPINVAPKMAYLSIIEESSEMRNLVSKERIRIAKECEAKTMELLNANLDKLHKLANYLIEHESITGEEMIELLKDE